MSLFTNFFTCLFVCFSLLTLIFHYFTVNLSSSSVSLPFGLERFYDTEALRYCSWNEMTFMGAIPGSRMYHSSTLYENSLYVFGGCDEKHSSKNSLFVLDTATRQWTRPVLRGPSPAHRHGHTATIVEDRLYVFGGMNRHGHFNDVHVLDLKTLTVGRFLELCTARITVLKHSLVPLDCC
jgi:hypothetical protein